MKFELEPFHRNISKAEILDDIREIAGKLQKTAITTSEYRKHSRFSPAVARRRFGSWFNALELAGLEKTFNYNASAEECIRDLKAVAKRLGKRAVTVHEYEDNGRMSVKPFIRHFGSWFKALEASGLERTRVLHVTNDDYFENLEKVWTSLGRQPRYLEMQKPLSRYCAGAYEHRFGSWRKALHAFVDYVNEGGTAHPNRKQNSQKSQLATQIQNKSSISRKPSRSISWRLRFLVMRHDDFKCRACGRSPSTHPGLILHVDHVEAWSKDGPTVMNNLQTLCERCNIGKSNLAMKDKQKGSSKSKPC